MNRVPETRLTRAGLPFQKQARQAPRSNAAVASISATGCAAGWYPAWSPALTEPVTPAMSSRATLAPKVAVRVASAPLSALSCSGVELAWQ